MTRRLSTVEQAVSLLELFDADHTEWRLSDLARQLSLPTSSVHEQLTTLCACGLLTRLGRGRYTLGLRLLKLSSALYGSLPWYSLAHAAMEGVARGTGLLSFVAVLERRQVVCIARSVQGRGQAATVMGETTYELPAHATASGKLLYAFAKLDFDAPVRFTPHTLARPWATEAQEIRRNEAAFSHDEWAIGTSSLAVPLFAEDQQVVAALGISLPSSQGASQDNLLRRLQQVADEVNWQLARRRKT